MVLSSVLCLLCTFLLLAACGKIGDPLPPFIRIPEAVKDLAATQSGHNIVLTWTNPPRNIDGSAATNLAHVQIRSNGALLAALNVNAAGKPQSYPVPVGPVANGQRTFTLIAETTQGKVSSVSNIASISPVEVPGSVTRLSALADQRKVIVEWDKPQEHPELADAYIVVRTDLQGESETVSETRYEDVQYQPGKTFTYQVTPVRRVSGTTVAGVGPESLTVVVEDKTAPRVPSGLDLTQSGNGAFLTWNANPEPDLAGYRVFRSDRADGLFIPVSERIIVSNSFIDTSHRPGFYYAVSAVDEFGNESAKSAAFRGP